MIEVIALHWGFEMVGALSLWFIMGVCKNPAHNHGGLITWIGQHPLLTQMAAAIPISIIMVTLVDSVLMDL